LEYSKYSKYGIALASKKLKDTATLLILQSPENQRGPIVRTGQQIPHQRKGKKKEKTKQHIPPS